MNCNVCAVETRCYQLREITGHPGMMMQGEGMIFNICSPCLTKLIAGITMTQTKVETPADVPIRHPRVAQVMDQVMQRHEIAKGGSVLEPPKPKEPNT